MTNKEKYIQYCENAKGLKIFYQPWWLDCVCNEQWDVAIAEEKENILGLWPYWKKVKYGISYIIMPKFTQISGPVILYPPDQSVIKRQSFYKKVMDLLFTQLPDAHWIRLNLDYEHLNWQPLYWKGFTQTTRYTYTIESPPSNPDLLLKSFSKSARQEIKKAQKNVSISETNDIEKFYYLNKKSFERKRQRLPFNFADLEKLYKIASENGRGKIIIAKDSEGKVHSGLFFIWDEQYVYYLAGGGMPHFRDSGSKFLLSSEAINFAAENNLSVNFLGSMIEGVSYYARQFGAIPVPYHVVQKVDNAVLKTYFSLRRM